MNLRNRGIYRLPNGRELIALVSTGKAVLLCKVNGANGIHYNVNEAGRLTHQGRLTAWSLEDLSDTGQTYMRLQTATAETSTSDLIYSL